VGPGYSEEIHYWLPEQGLGLVQPGKEPQGGSDANTRRSTKGIPDRPSDAAQGGAPMGVQEPAFCQGRVLVTLTPAAATGAGPRREVFVSRGATGQCAAVPNCPLKTCREALERVLVYDLDTRF
jgi:hypothetical protein